MKAATERKIIRWLHIIASIPIIGYIYGPVSQIPNAVTAIKWVLFPLIVLSGLWLWKGHWVRKSLRKLTSAQKKNDTLERPVSSQVLYHQDKNKTGGDYTKR